MIWIVLKTAPQREIEVSKDVAQTLSLATCVPCARKFRKGRAKGNKPVLIPYLLPLLPGYVFVGCRGLFPLRKIRDLDYVQGFVQFDASPATLSDAEVDRMRQMAHKSRVETPGGYETGDAVQIKSGPFMGMASLIGEIRGGEVRVDVQLFGRATPMWLTADRLDKAEAA